MGPPEGELGAAFAALSDGDLAGARAGFEAALAQADAPLAHEVLSGICIGLDDLTAARRHGETA